MHIVFISREYVPTLRGGGIASYVKDMASALVDAGHQVTVIAASDDTRMESDIVENNIRVIRLSGGDFIIPAIEGNSKLKKLRCIYRFYSYRKKIKKTLLSLDNVDIVEVPEYGAESYLLNNLPFPIVVRLHTPAYLDRKTFTKKNYSWGQFYEQWCAKKEEKLLQETHYISSCSKSLKDWVNKYFQVDNDKIEVIYNPIEIEQWKSELSSFNPDSINILFVGTVAKEKGVGDLVTACRILINKGYSIRLTIAGKLGQYGEVLKFSTNEEEWCSFHGNVPRVKLKQLYSQHEISCFPSWWDNLPLVCIEAMMAGTLVIGSNSGGMAEIIEDGEDGFLITPQNPSLLVEKILEIHSLSSEEKESIRENAKRKVEIKFSTDAVVVQMTNYYKDVISKFNKQ